MNYWKLKIVNNNLWLSYYKNKIWNKIKLCIALYLKTKIFNKNLFIWINKPQPIFSCAFYIYFIISVLAIYILTIMLCKSLASLLSSSYLLKNKKARSKFTIIMLKIC